MESGFFAILWTHKLKIGQKKCCGKITDIDLKGNNLMPNFIKQTEKKNTLPVITIDSSQTLVKNFEE